MKAKIKFASKPVILAVIPAKPSGNGGGGPIDFESLAARYAAGAKMKDLSAETGINRSILFSRFKAVGVHKPMFPNGRPEGHEKKA